MATDLGTTEVVLQAAINMIGGAHWSLNYMQWLDKLDAPDDEYWQDKWQEWQILAKAVNYFDAGTLARIVQK